MDSKIEQLKKKLKMAWIIGCKQDIINKIEDDIKMAIRDQEVHQ